MEPTIHVATPDREGQVPRVPKLFTAVLWLIPGVIAPWSARAQIQQAWVARYNNGIMNGTNQAVKMALDSTGNIYVLGFSQNTNTNLGYVTIKYAPSGTQCWAARYDSTNYPSATPSGFALDSSNNVVVTGSAVTVRYDSNGNQLWTAPYDGASIALDSGGNAIVTGTRSSFTTVKINAAGSNVWQVTLPDSAGPALSQIVLTDNSNNSYVSGSETFYCDAVACYVQLDLFKYDQNGNQLWSGTYGAGGPARFVKVWAAELDSANNFYLIANCSPDPFATVIKFSNNGDLLWSTLQNQGLVSGTLALTLDHRLNTIVADDALYAYNDVP